MEITKYVLGLLLLILKEYFAYIKKKRDTNAEAKLDIEEFKKIVDQAMIRLRTSYKEENTQVGNVEDQVDRERERARRENADIQS
jgi:hypothetical protein